MKMYKKPAIKTSEVGLVQMIAYSINSDGSMQGTSGLTPGDGNYVDAGIKDMTETNPDYDDYNTEW